MEASRIFNDRDQVIYAISLLRNHANTWWRNVL